MADNNSSTGWMDILGKGVDIAGSVIGAQFGVQTAANPQPAVNAAMTVPGATGAIGGIPTGVLLAGAGILGAGLLVLLVMRR